ncbi:MAG TPA: DedA family protein [Solirubrobacteraceae bacterium]|jgi:membrane protein DedA with SNARE-associated domain|nr:DedA family protein [Solirubrobacteraceae bacterium]
MLTLAALISVSGGLGYALPALVGLESMGVPVPGETALVLAAVLASEGKLNIVLVIAIACAAAIVGDNIGYFLGRKLGREVLEAPGPFQKRRKRALDAGQRFFDRHGSKAVFFGRWVAIVRIAAAWLAGIERMKFTHFFFWNALGGITWATTYGLVGYYGGKAVANAITKFGIYAAIAFGVLIVAWLVFSRVREHRAAQSLDAPEEPSAGSKPPAEPAAEPPSESASEEEPEPADKS